MAVDFAAKRWMDSGGASHLRLAKLRTTRKVLFAGSLASVLLVREAATGGYESMLEYLLEEFDVTPLARLCRTYDALGADSQAAMGRVLEAYDEFVGVLNSSGRRTLIESETRGADLRANVDALGDVIEEGLESIFFDDPLFSDLTRKYALF